MLAILDEMRRTGARPAPLQPEDRLLRRRAVDQRDARRARERARHPRLRHLRPVRSDRPRRRLRDASKTKDGPTIWEDHFYPEIVDPATGAPLPDGEHGELVLTSLTKEAMPVIRYRTRDLTRLLPGDGAHDAADGEGHRPLRRHDHPARRQRLPQPDRGADPQVPRPRRPITCSSSAARGGSTR